MTTTQNGSMETRVLNRMLREEYGVKRDFTLEEASRLQQAVLAIAKGDGKLSEAERFEFLARARRRGADDETLRNLSTTQPARDALDTLDDDTMRPLGAALIYDALRVARADGVAWGEMALAVNTADLLGVEDATVGRIQDILRREEELRKERLVIIAPRDPDGLF